MDKYKEGFNHKIKPKRDYNTGETVVEPFKDAQLALSRAAFADQQKEEFFNDAYSDILSELFVAWLKTEPHCQKEREYLYSTAMALGSVKEKLISYSMFGRNSAFIGKKAQEGAEESENE
jgi:hypothetical protein